jgi:hypothetical protein
MGTTGETLVTAEQQDDIRIIPMETRHVGAVVRIHEVAFPGYFLTFLGSRFLWLLYTEILKTAGNSSIVAWSNERQETVGFAVSVASQESFYTRLVRQRLSAFAFAALGAAIRKPRIIPRLFRALKYPSMSREAPADACFLSMGVLPDMRGHRIAQRMTSGMMALLKSQGVESVLFVIDRDVNPRAKKFHYRFGAKKVREYQTPEGRWMEDLVLDLTSWDPDNHDSTSSNDSRW